MKDFFAASTMAIENMVINLDYVAVAERHIDSYSGQEYIDVYMVGCQYPFTIDGNNWDSLTTRLFEEDEN